VLVTRFEKANVRVLREWTFAFFGNADLGRGRLLEGGTKVDGLGVVNVGVAVDGLVIIC